ncbi:MAG: hypothetical protein KAU90_02650 [Sulfurovaceae bacterium]|nr:hypothetical protein [Sulfurovaceae bacterium]
MNRVLGLSIATILVLFLFSCQKEGAVPKNIASSNQYQNRQFGQIRHNDDNIEDEVICQNCRAHFKLKRKWRKLAMKGNAEIDCPVCHHNYLKKASN